MAELDEPAEFHTRDAAGPVAVLAMPRPAIGGPALSSHRSVGRIGVDEQTRLAS